MKKSNTGGGFSLKGIFGGGKKSAAAGKALEAEAAQIKAINQSDAFSFGAGGTTVATLLTAGRKQARARQTIYDKLAEIEADGLVSSALSLLVTSALGGHETSGALVFVEKTPAAHADKALGKRVEEIAADIAPFLNAGARQTTYTASAFGDAYARVYAEKGVGVTDIYDGELVRPPLVLPYEKGSRTVGYALFTGPESFDRLSNGQMARMKMPRQGWVPQHGVVEKSFRLLLTEDDVSNLPLMPSMVGGSFLSPIEDAFRDYRAALVGLVSQRLLDSFDERLVAVNMADMTADQQKVFAAALIKIFKDMKNRMAQAVENDMPSAEVSWNFMPTWGEKQVTQITSPNAGSSGRAGSMGVEDVLLHAKRVAGGLGIDITLLGFADLMAGGLGEGGFFRTSAQAAERARVIRLAHADFCNQIIDVHTLHKYGMVYPASERPWQINYYGSIAALESERQKTRMDAMNGGAMLIQVIQQLKEAGFNRAMMESYLSHQMALDEDQAKLYAGVADMAPPPADGGGGMM